MEKISLNNSDIPLPNVEGRTEVDNEIISLQNEGASLEAEIEAVTKDLLKGLDDNLPAEHVLISRILELEDRFRYTLRELAVVAGIGTVLLTAVFKHTPSPDESWQEKRDRAAVQMEEEGITWEQRSAYVIGMNELIYRGIGPLHKTPSTLEDWNSLSSHVWENLTKGRENAYRGSIKGKTDAYKKKALELIAQIEANPFDSKIDINQLELKDNSVYEQQEDNPGEEDSWRLYLGLPQKYQTYKISDFQPTSSKEKMFYYAFNSLRKEFHGLDRKGVMEHIVKKLEGRTGSVSSSEVNEIIVGSKTMYHFQWSKGQDERGPYVAYYDIWDLDVPIEEKGFFGKPFEIYDRIHYDTQTYEIIDFK